MKAPFNSAAGFGIAPQTLSKTQLDRLLGAIPEIPAAGLRQPHVVLAVVSELIRAREVRELVEPVLGPRAQVVRSVLFDKTSESNWGVPWHQDLTIAVEERREVEGFIGWSVKDGIHHVQAPLEVLERMLAVRLHLDDCGPENGPLRVLPGTHLKGWLNSMAIDQAKHDIESIICAVPRGGAVLMRPLLLHASSRAKEQKHRRVLHLEFAAEELPGGLRFYSA